MDYLNMQTITDEDFSQARLVLSNLGYTFDEGSDPVYIQFNKKHNIK